MWLSLLESRDHYWRTVEGSPTWVTRAGRVRWRSVVKLHMSTSHPQSLYLTKHGERDKQSLESKPLRTPLISNLTCEPLFPSWILSLILVGKVREKTCEFKQTNKQTCISLYRSPNLLEVKQSNLVIFHGFFQILVNWLYFKMFLQ